jgi:hypothetical protein
MDIKSPSFPAGFDQKNASESHPQGKPIGSERARSFAGANPYLYLTGGGGVKEELEGNSREAKAQAIAWSSYGQSQGSGGSALRSLFAGQKESGAGIPAPHR